METQQITLNTNGKFYNFLKNKNKYEKAYLKCMENTVTKLQDQQTSANKPGMLLGKIQSGKTRTFLGAMGLAYDNNYDVVIILTKGTKALVKQTIARLNEEFGNMILQDNMKVYDIINLPSNLSKWELNQKLALVVKKETKNMDRLKKAIFETYPLLREKNILFIDDEADFASVSYEKDPKKNTTEMKVISSKIDDIRGQINNGSFLQVTATPYSLYLQPEERKINELVKFEPIKPAFTELVPVHDKYIGGEYYFNESKNHNSPAYYLYQEISDYDLIVMKKPDLRRVRQNNLLLQKNIKNLNRAVINFIVGSSIRRWQQESLQKEQEKYSMVIHTDRGKQAHEWQQQLINLILEDLSSLSREEPNTFKEFIKQSFDSLMSSVKLCETPQPCFEDILESVRNALLQEMIIVSTVNSDKEVEELLDNSGQLQLRTPMNIFIGGQILDRGITISNLIGFFYGRNPKSFQQDTVLQHSRMFGARSIKDMAVTRFYTTRQIYNIMSRIHEFDSELRKAFERGHDQGVVFVQKDVSNKIIPCSPNKILLSDLTVLKPHKRILPYGFQTRSKSRIQEDIKKISQILLQLEKQSLSIKQGAFLAPIDEIKNILSIIHSTFVMEEGYEWDLEEYFSILDYLARNTKQAHIWVIIREERNIKRKDSQERFEDSPDTPKGNTSELQVARAVAKEHPAIIMLKQNGKEENGWNGASFWWPVIFTQSNIESTIYAKDTIK